MRDVLRKRDALKINTVFNGEFVTKVRIKVLRETMNSFTRLICESGTNYTL